MVFDFLFITYFLYFFLSWASSLWISSYAISASTLYNHVLACLPTGFLKSTLYSILFFSNPLLGKHNVFSNSVYPALDLWNRVNASTKVSIEYRRRFRDTVNNCNCSAKKLNVFSLSRSVPIDLIESTRDILFETILGLGTVLKR